MTITIDALADHLNDHSRMFANEIATKTRVGLELEPILTQRVSTGEYYVIENAEATEVLQPYQGTFTPKGTLTHSEETIRVRPIKMDLQFTEGQLEKWWNTWQVSRFDVEKDPMEWSFPKYIVEKEIMPKFQDDLNRVAWLGEYAAPTPGTAGDAVDAVDGYKKIIADLITAGKINDYATGTITTSNIRDKVEEFLAQIPDEITIKGGKILMSPKHRRWYIYDYRGEFSAIPQIQNPNQGPRPVFADDYNIELKSVATMSGSDRWVFVPNGRENMVWVSRQGAPTYPQMIFKTQARVLQLYATIYRGYGFEYPTEIYTNDQP
jgi:hypothetical protein